jgi:predicted esterase
MRRFALLLALAALAGLVLAAGAGAESRKPNPRVMVKTGGVHLEGKKLVGTVVMTNAGRRASGREYVELGIGVPAGVAGSSTLVQRLVVKPLDVGKKEWIHFSRPLPAEATPGSWTVNACVDGGACRRIGQVTIAPPAPAATPTPAPSAPEPTPTPPAPTPAPPAEETIVPPQVDPPSDFPTDPIPYVAGEPFRHATTAGVEYFGFVPRNYDATNSTPTALLVWLHGCGGEAEGDAWVVDPEEAINPRQKWMTLSLAGREGGAEGTCWVPSLDEPKVMAAIADFETHFNVNRREVLIGGYSSGGDLAYRTGFRNSSSFAALLIENSSPFKDTESSAAESLAAATTRPRIIHLAHSGDLTYRIGAVRKEVLEVAAAGFPIELIEKPGEHWDSNTDSDLREFLLARIDDLLAGLDRLT